MYEEYQAVRQQAASLEEAREELQHEVAQLRALLAHETGASARASSPTPGSSSTQRTHGGLMAHLRGMGGGKVSRGLPQQAELGWAGLAWGQRQLGSSAARLELGAERWGPHLAIPSA
jgi:hypothetical protein